MLLRSQFSRPSIRAARLGLAAATVAGALGLLAGCGDVVLTDGRTLTRADQFVTSDAVASESKLFIDPTLPQTVRTVRIVPTAFTEAVSGPGLDAVERRLIANAADRALCYDLSLRYDIVSAGPADLTVRSAITRIDLTNVPAAGTTIAASTAISIAGQVGVGFANTVGKIPVPRVPIGLGSLTIEAEALDARKRQRAAMIWGGAANAFTNSARFSAASDAYDLAGEFGQDFGSYLATTKDPFRGELQIPTYDRIRITTLGEAPLDPDCAVYGRAPGIDGILGDMIGLPPDWTDKGGLR
ncbi:hypothetical protein ASG52_05890 [Methylobacterium sp. Leaf456]|uniref:DUF3313 domain-containing protein n=1 Tax=Methylobacterium sp. Leaf456 TaxID=1736382 RepID=UPI0007000446|nr:DUF3313 domain-containing protein [Methylobacterium sp. Leaf456]KQT50354.1 hypothetical protein ASG52_05890 [Methylobacterium sp. Leaf456]